MRGETKLIVNSIGFKNTIFIDCIFQVNSYNAMYGLLYGNQTFKVFPVESQDCHFSVKY